MMIKRVKATSDAVLFIECLIEKHGPLMFLQSGGCCDGSSPMCYLQGELVIGDCEVYLGEIGGCPFYMNKAQYDDWKHTQLIIDVVEGGSGIFSVEEPKGKRFLTRSRVFSEEERIQLEERR